MTNFLFRFTKESMKKPQSLQAPEIHAESNTEGDYAPPNIRLDLHPHATSQNIVSQ